MTSQPNDGAARISTTPSSPDTRRAHHCPAPRPRDVGCLLTRTSLLRDPRQVGWFLRGHLSPAWWSDWAFSGHLSPHPTSGSDFRISREASIGSPHGMRRVFGTPHTSAVGFNHTARGMRHPRNLPSLSSCHPTSSIAIILYPHSSQTPFAIDVRQSHGGGLLSDCALILSRST